MRTVADSFIDMLEQMHPGRFYSESSICQVTDANISSPRGIQQVGNTKPSFDSSALPKFNSCVIADVPMVRISSTCLFCPSTSHCLHLNKLSQASISPCLSSQEMGDDDIFIDPCVDNHQSQSEYRHRARFSVPSNRLLKKGSVLDYVITASVDALHPPKHKPVIIKNEELLYDFHESTVSLPFDAIQPDSGTATSTGSSSSEGSFNLTDIKEKSHHVAPETRSSSRATQMKAGTMTRFFHLSPLYRALSSPSLLIR